MNYQQVVIKESKKQDHHEFLDQILKNCDINNQTGKFHCKKCRNIVRIDWHRHLAYCGMHIISKFGCTYIGEIYHITF